MNANSTQNNIPDRHTERWARREERRAHRFESRGGGWIIGLLLILLAVILLLQNLNIDTLNNWWSLFILIPALASFAAAWRISKAAGGHFNMRASSSLIVGLILVLVTAMFLFSMNWTILGPILLALAGIGLIVNVMLPN
jgi:ABC-type uncharacterized transport system permease subunit